eukprot:COSAG01_NODE_6029_length_3890_cov_13.018992_4_plen_318_part_00
MPRLPAWGDARAAPAMPSPTKTLKSGSFLRGQSKVKLHRRILLRLRELLHSTLNGSAAALGKAIKVLALLEALLFAATIATAALQTDTVSMSRDLTYAAIGTVSAAAGFMGAKYSDRGVLMMYFVLLLWGVASSTSNINANVLERNKQAGICDHQLTVTAQEEQDMGVSGCSTQLAVLTIKLVAIAANLLLQIVRDALPPSFLLAFPVPTLLRLHLARGGRPRFFFDLRICVGVRLLVCCCGQVSAWVALRMSEAIQEDAEEQQQAVQAKTTMDINFRRSSMMVSSKRKSSIAVGAFGGGGGGAASGPLAAMMAGKR